MYDSTSVSLSTAERFMKIGCRLEITSSWGKGVLWGMVLNAYDTFLEVMGKSNK